MQKQKPGPKITMIRVYEPWMADRLREHVVSGYSVRSFPSFYNINQEFFSNWIRDIPDLRNINILYKQKKNFEKLKFNGTSC